MTSGDVDGAGVRHLDVFAALQVWLYAAILTVGYMISRGLAKAGSEQHSTSTSSASRRSFYGSRTVRSTERAVRRHGTVAGQECT